MFFFFFFKQKTAYEIKECDWSSDVCSSDLALLEKPTKSLLDKIKISLKELWGIETQIFIKEVVENLALKILIKQKNNVVPENIFSTVSLFFEIDNPQINQEITENILIKVGAFDG